MISLASHQSNYAYLDCSVHSLNKICSSSLIISLFTWANEANNNALGYCFLGIYIHLRQPLRDFLSSNTLLISIFKLSPLLMNKQ